MKVYIEDTSPTELQINGVNVRKLGTLANGETGTFEIGEDELRVYVIGDKLSKNYCSDFAVIPAGSEDVALKGRNHLDPSVRNAFIFEGSSGNTEAV